jgi:hypothetical protein
MDLGLSADGATLLLGFWQKLDPETGALLHDFTDPAASTRFLGDLYQDLSEKARKKYALLQTPEFVERFILDRTLTPAIEEFGFATVRLIDPTCGTWPSVTRAYRARFESCHMKYALSVPFMERFFDLAISPEARMGPRFRGGDERESGGRSEIEHSTDTALFRRSRESGNPSGSAGFVGQITSNSFMKRELGKIGEPPNSLRLRTLPPEFRRPLVEGERAPRARCGVLGSPRMPMTARTVLATGCSTAAERCSSRRRPSSSCPPRPPSQMARSTASSFPSASRARSAATSSPNACATTTQRGHASPSRCAL